MSLPTLATTPATEVSISDDATDYNSAVAKTLTIVVEEIYLRVAKGTSVPPQDCDSGAGSNDPEVDDFTESSGRGGVNGHLDVTTEWTVFRET